MKGNLVIVESPNKTVKIKSYLGDGYTVESSYGHIRDLEENNLSIDIKNGFKPKYVIPAKQKKVVEKLKKLADQAETVWLASDEDREGEAIAWHLFDTLGLDPARTKRIVFHEITKPAILEAVKNPRDIDMNLVAAQQARRVLDRLVGFELSPVLWKKIQPKLSAGRVQSVALRLIVDREREIQAFGSEQYYKVDAVFVPQGSSEGIKATLDKHFANEEQARAFLEKSIGAEYTICDISAKEGTRSPAAPFTTSTLQQEAARKLGMSVSQIMQTAQKLYEEGLITYMRTDSVNLSSLALSSTKQLVCDNFGAEYSKTRQYKTKSKSAQEAHEAIRPTYIDKSEISGSPAERRLYQLIWKRTVASQMADAKVLNTTIRIASDKTDEKWIVETSQVLFDGFLKLYTGEADDEERQIEYIAANGLEKGTRMIENGITAECKFTAAPARYSQGTLVKKLEELGIGRPSTYASIITTLVRGRGYVIEGNKEGHSATVTNLALKNGRISSSQKKETIGGEKKKLLPQDIGIMVSDYLVANFSDIVDYGFTADVEKDFDEIATGKNAWNKMISGFYDPFHAEVKNTLANTGYSHMEKVIGVDPADGRQIIAKYGQYGPYVQKGEGSGKICVSLAKGQIIESLTLEDALKLLQLPRTLGEMDGTQVTVTKGRFGAYIRFGNKNVSIPNSKDPLTITLEEAVTLIRELTEKPAQEILAQWGDLQIIKGKYGPYIKSGNSNYKIPKEFDAYNLKEDEARKIVESTQPTAKKRSYFKKK
ncbi:MAG: type I DNA topoisomerase [Bacteroidales bacterium]|nr:type I DNA topoisomerase [Candidatus Hennigimonas equi]